MAKFSERRLREIRGDKISMIFQNPLTSLNPVFTVGEQIAMVLRKHKNIGNKQAMEEAGKLMETVGIAKRELMIILTNFPVECVKGLVLLRRLPAVRNC